MHTKWLKNLLGGVAIAAAGLTPGLNGADGGNTGGVTSAAKPTPPQPNPKLKAIAPNTGIDLGEFNVENPEGEPENSSRRVTDYSGMAYDPHNHRILMFGGGHAATFSDAIYSFDLQTLTWKALYRPTPQKYYSPDNMDRSFWKAGGEGKYPRPVGRHTYDLLIVPAHEKSLYLLRNGCGPSDVAKGIGYFGGGSGIYDFTKEAWDIIPPVPFGGYGSTAEYDPVSRTVIGIEGQSIYVFDPAKKTSTTAIGNIIDKHKVTSYSGTTVYNPIDQHMYSFPSKMEPWRLELNRADMTQSKVVKLEPKGDRPPEKECAFVWDAGNKVFGGNIQAGVCYGLDPAANAWLKQEIQGLDGADMIFHCLIYEPVNQVYIFIGKNKTGKRTFAFRLKPSVAVTVKKP